MRFYRTGFANAEEHDQSKDGGGQRVGDEQDQVVVAGHQSRKERSNGRAQIDGPVVVAVGTRPRFGWDQVGNRRADSRPVEIHEESHDECCNRYEEKISGKPQHDHKNGGNKEAQQHDRSAAQPVGQFAAGQLGQERARTEERNDQRGASHRDGTLGGQVKGQKRDDETTQPVDEGPGPDQPERGRQAFCENGNPILFHDFLRLSKV